MSGYGYRYRRLDPHQVREVRRSYDAGVAAVDLASCYGVTERTIYRSIRRAVLPVHAVTVDGWTTTFELTEDGPVQVTPWVPA